MSDMKQNSNKSFWENVERTAKAVESWPEWKQRGAALADFPQASTGPITDKPSK
ncbi:MAG: hypothetical protein Tsb0020_47710 [Haliangiales bacterium]